MRMRVRSRKKWNELGTGERVGVVALAAVEMALTTWAGSDLASRDASQVRGPKWLWSAALLVQPVGPVAYLLAGRR